MESAFRRMGIGRSTGYGHIKNGLITRPVRMSANAVGVPEEEIDSIIAARVAGADDDAVRALVVRLHDRRKAMAEVAA
jgi:prophage regulatory protein